MVDLGTARRLPQDERTSKARKSFAGCNNREPRRVSVIAQSTDRNAELLNTCALQKRPVIQYPRVKDAADYIRVSNYRLFVI